MTHDDLKLMKYLERDLSQAPDVHSANAEDETEMATQETEQSNAHEATRGSLGRYRHRPSVLPQSTNGEKHLEKR